ncbi:MAG: DDE transposase [Alphaproteobacteria bacterium]|nr:MAG: DDE transposase [Alphaproteobacteria bacterium]
MRKIRRIYETTQEINFLSPQKEFSLYWNSFLKADLGKLHQSIPWKELAKSLKIKEYKKGPARIFSPQGMLALMFLKSYVDCSDKKLIEYLNGSIDFQMFCGIFLGTERISNYKIVSDIRSYLASGLDIKETQKILACYWKPYIHQPNIMLEDATCYETSMRYPTNVKLLWECTQWSYGQLKHLCKYLKIRMPRTKYLIQEGKYTVYSRKRKKLRQETNVRTRSLLYLLNKLLEQLDEVETQHKENLTLPRKYYEHLHIIKSVLNQQRQMFVTGNSVPDKIVSIAKSYIRPIVRGKETKGVEFGAKVNMIQFDGINFIEHLSFSAFHEGIRLPQSIRYGRELFGKITHVSADDIYATNKNRKYCTSKTITNNFKRKGRAGKHEEHRRIIASALRKERATRMEGSFGTEKEYYGLQKIKARTRENEILWIFFGVHTANAVRIAKRLSIDKTLLKTG